MSQTFPALFGLMFAAAMLISSIGFYKYVYFISLGYGFSIAGLGILMAVVFQGGYEYRYHAGMPAACSLRCSPRRLSAGA